MGLDRRLIELTRGSRRWIAATVTLGWLIAVSYTHLTLPTKRIV